MRIVVMDIVALALVGLLLSAGAGWAGPVIETLCQKNLADGRILIQDEKVLPTEDATFKVLSFKAASSDDTWAEGPCTIKVTGRAR